MQGLQTPAIAVIVGRKGSGKSNLTRAVLRQLWESGGRTLAIDMHGEYEGCVIEDPRALEEYLNNRGQSQPFRIAYRDNGRHGYSWDQVFTMLHGLSDCVLVLEEASRWTLESPEPVRHFFQYGRHRRISIVSVARRPYELDRITTASADVIVSFEQHEPRDLEWLTRVGGADVAARVSTLPEYSWEYVLTGHAEFETLLTATVETETGAVAPAETREDPPPAPAVVTDAADPTRRVSPLHRTRGGRWVRKETHGHLDDSPHRPDGSGVPVPLVADPQREQGDPGARDRAESR